MINTTRKIIFNILFDFFKTTKSYSVLLEKHLELNQGINKKDINYIVNAIKGIFRKKSILEANINKYSRIKIQKIDLHTLILLYMGTFELIFCDSVPSYATINTIVNLSKYKKGKSSKFINAILRQIDNSNIDIINIKDLSIKYSYPKWILEKMNTQYKKNTTISIIENDSNIPPIWIRINKLKTNSNEVSKILHENSIEYYQDQYLDNYYKIKNFDNNNVVKELIKCGFIYIQNPSSGFVVQLINAKKNNIILDACCAPGGKSSLIAANLNNLVQLHCLDINTNRITRTKNNFNRLNVKNVKFMCDNALSFNSQVKYDKILLDLPCSSSGTIRKNPDIKWKLTNVGIKEFQYAQYNILTNLSKLLNINGEIIYSTCSLFTEENEENIIHFLKNYKEFKISDIDVNLPNFIFNKIGGITILPNKYDYEGMFAIKLRKNA